MYGQMNISREDLLVEQPNVLGMIDLLRCPICSDIMYNPVKELKNQHSFCSTCVRTQKVKISVCPLCREPSEFVRAFFENNLINLLKFKCPQYVNGCEWTGSGDLLVKHTEDCYINIELGQKQLKHHIKEMKRILDLGINPHLKDQHIKIYDTYVKDWKFLQDDDREWKWWWWAKNPWWEEPCKKCNELWHYYEDEIEVHERYRQQLQRVLLRKQD